MMRPKPGFLEEKLRGEAVQEGAAYVLSLIPYEETTTYKQGTAGAPEAVVEASAHVELYDCELSVDASCKGILTLRPEIRGLGSVTEHAAMVAANHPQALLGFVGGEHSITPAVIAGLGRRDLGIVWIDAHADLRKEYKGRRDNHACAAYNCLGLGPIVQVGVRSMAAEEKLLLEGAPQVKAVRAWGAEAREAIAALPPSIYLSIDVDGLSPTLIRAVGTPEPGGLSWDETMEVLDFLFSHKRVIAFDMVELCPVPDDVTSAYAAARLVYKVISYHAAMQG